MSIATKSPSSSRFPPSSLASQSSHLVDTEVLLPPARDVTDEAGEDAAELVVGGRGRFQKECSDRCWLRAPLCWLAAWVWGWMKELAVLFTALGGVCGGCCCAE
jgi:hypothetical protein